MFQPLILKSPAKESEKQSQAAARSTFVDFVTFCEKIKDSYSPYFIGVRRQQRERRMFQPLILKSPAKESEKQSQGRGAKLLRYLLIRCRLTAARPTGTTLSTSKLPTSLQQFCENY